MYYMKSECVQIALEKRVKVTTRKKLLLQIYALGYIPSAHKVEALLRKLEQCEVMQDVMFVDGKRKYDKRPSLVNLQIQAGALST